MSRLAAVLGFLMLFLVATTVVGATNVINLDGDGAPAGVEFVEGTDVFSADTEGDVRHRGRGLTPGYFSVVDADSERYHVMVYELLHNAVGRLDVPEACPDDPYHHCTHGGWLEQRTRPGSDDFLIDSVAEQIEDEGFAR